MCGIVGVLGLPGAPQKVREGLARLEYRGYDSAGVAWVQEGRVETVKRVGRVVGLPPVPEGSPSIAIGHTRWATHGGVTDANAHPHRDPSGRFAVVHNGTIEGHLRLRHALEAQGVALRSETDTEILVHLYADRRKTHAPLEAVRQTFAGLEGSWACLFLDAPAQAIAFACRRTPLLIGLGGQGEAFFASDVTALLAHTRRVLYLEDGDHGVADASGLRLFRADGTPRPLEPHTVDWSSEQAEKGGYPHFMLKEIHDSPVALNQCLAGRIRWEPLGVDVGIDATLLAGVRRIRLVAAGTSYHAALMGRDFLENWAGIPSEALLSSELRQRPMLEDQGVLYIGVSQSGETLDTIEAMRHVKRLGQPVLAVTNVQGSTLQRMADAAILTRVGPEVGVAATKTFLGQVATLALLALQVGQARNRLVGDELRRVAEDLERLPRIVDEVLGQEEAIADLGRRLAAAHDLFFLGRGIHVATALEAALKFKEITYRHAEGFGAAELKHGPFALLGPETPCVFFLGRDDNYERVVSNLAEVQARHAPTFAITQGGLEDVEELVGAAVQVPATHPLLAAVPFSVAAQLLSYHAAVSLGRDVDMPRNLAKSVTVE